MFDEKDTTRHIHRGARKDPDRTVEVDSSAFFAPETAQPVTPPPSKKPPRQNGSSIMPGKVNPVIPEVVSQVAFNIIGNDVTVTMAAEAGQLELNAFEPIIFYNLIQSVETLTYAVHTFVDNCVTGITANRERCRDMVEHSVGIITALCPHVGYEKAAEVAKRAIETGAPVRRLILEEGLLDEAALDKILDPYSMTEPGISGKELLEG